MAFPESKFYLSTSIGPLTPCYFKHNNRFLLNLLTIIWSLRGELLQDCKKSSFYSQSGKFSNNYYLEAQNRSSKSLIEVESRSKISTRAVEIVQPLFLMREETVPISYFTSTCFFITVLHTCIIYIGYLSIQLPGMTHFSRCHPQ